MVAQTCFSLSSVPHSQCPYLAPFPSHAGSKLDSALSNQQGHEHKAVPGKFPAEEKGWQLGWVTWLPGSQKGKTCKKSTPLQPLASQITGQLSNSLCWDCSRIPV